jgi:hypothetical protein
MKESPEKTVIIPQGFKPIVGKIERENGSGRLLPGSGIRSKGHSSND